MCGGREGKSRESFSEGDRPLRLLKVRFCVDVRLKKNWVSIVGLLFEFGVMVVEFSIGIFVKRYDMEKN